MTITGYDANRIATALERIADALELAAQVPAESIARLMSLNPRPLPPAEPAYPQGDPAPNSPQSLTKRAIGPMGLETFGHDGMSR